MLYCVDLTVPANTPRTSPVRQDIEIKSGVLRKVSVMIPAGHFALAHLVIMDGETQIVPHEGDIHGNDEIFTFDEWIEIPEPKRTLTLLGWNEDDSYDHTFYVRILVLPRWLASPELYLGETLDRLLGALGLLPSRRG